LGVVKTYLEHSHSQWHQLNFNAFEAFYVLFFRRYYFATVPENIPIGSDVVRLLATSRDTGINADITYSIVAGNEHRKFRINPKSGVIVVAGEIDHETAKDYFLTIQAQDGGEPPLSNHATVNITVQDLNDNSPVFSRP